MLTRLLDDAIHPAPGRAWHCMGLQRRKPSRARFARLPDAAKHVLSMSLSTAVLVLDAWSEFNAGPPAFLVHPQLLAETHRSVARRLPAFCHRACGLVYIVPSGRRHVCDRTVPCAQRIELICQSCGSFVFTAPNVWPSYPRYASGGRSMVEC